MGKTKNVMKIVLAVLRWITVPLFTLLLTVIAIILFTRGLESFALSVICGVSISAIIWGTIYIFYKKVKNPVITGMSIVTLLLVILFAERLDENPTPKPAPEGKVIEYWKLSTGSRLGYVKYLPETDNGKAPILYMHGGPGASTAFGFNLAKLLAESGYTVYTFDQAGVGYSDNIPAKEYGMIRSIEDIEAIRETIGVPKITIIGHSFGGVLAAAYMTKYDKNVDAAILMAPGGYGNKEILLAPNITDLQDGTPGKPALKSMPIRLVCAMVLNSLGATPSVVEDIFSQQQAKKYVEDNLDLDRFARGCYCIGKTPKEVHPYMKYINMNLIVNIFTTESMRNYTNQEDLTKIETPVLILRGECDYISVEAVNNYHKKLPDSRLVHLKGFGHDIMQEGAPLNNIIEFLNTESL
ncbi:MAG: alpha/beta hydrolase [Bacteroidales bacterium]|jgi:proline iminopeptidase|nr:alpha/beta hydrolase [Bacteroidales bacterium]